MDDDLLVPMALSLIVITALTEPTTASAQDTALQSAGIATGVAAGMAVLGVGLTAGAMDHARRARLDELQEDPPSDCMTDEILGCFELDFDIAPDVGGPILVTSAALANAGAIGWSAAAGHLWAQRDAWRGDLSRRRAVATTTTGSIALVAGLGLHVGGWVMLDTMCRGEYTDVDPVIACVREESRGAIAMSTMGALTFDVGAGLVGYGGTMLRARPTFAPSRQGALVGMHVAF